MKKYITFEEATTEYVKLTGESPKFDKMCELYHLYRTTFKSYKWESFKEFIEWNR